MVVLKFWFTAPLIGDPFISHWFPLGADEDIVTFPPMQNVKGPPALITGTAGAGFTVTSIVVPVPVHPAAEAVIVYLTTAGLPELLVRVWEMTAPDPAPKPDVEDPD
jgi:hypothetical protein